MNKGDISRFPDDNKQLDISQCSPVVDLAARFYSNSTFKWQISTPFLVLWSVAPPTHITNSDISV